MVKMNKYNIIIIGGGVAGMQAATVVAEQGLSAIIIDDSNTLGGKVAHKHSLFPTFTPVHEVLNPLITKIEASDSITVALSSSVVDIDSSSYTVTYKCYNEEFKVQGEAIIIATGYSFFDATQKQEYGYEIYDNVYTSFELEEMLKRGEVVTREGRVPESVAFIHCVGSRDSKIGNEHCSRVCCVTGVKQAIELTEHIKGLRVFNFYMDMRMFGIGYEEMYKVAQEKHQVRFIRGRVSEVAEAIDKRVRLKAEDTLIARPIAITVDMIVLLVGMCGAESNKTFASNIGATIRDNGFLRPVDTFANSTLSGVSGVFYAGSVESPKNVGESMNHATVATLKAINYIKG